MHNITYTNILILYTHAIITQDEDVLRGARSLSLYLFFLLSFSRCACRAYTRSVHSTHVQLYLFLFLFFFFFTFFYISYTQVSYGQKDMYISCESLFMAFKLLLWCKKEEPDYALSVFFFVMLKKLYYLFCTPKFFTYSFHASVKMLEYVTRLVC